jgi:hypothetical protein
MFVKKSEDKCFFQHLEGFKNFAKIYTMYLFCDIYVIIHLTNTLYNNIGFLLKSCSLKLYELSYPTQIAHIITLFYDIKQYRAGYLYFL